MLRHRLCKFGKTSLLALFALLFGGMFNSCQDHFDEYTYDDGDTPPWLGKSVYAFLRENNSGHTYNYYADIVDALGETETFNKTGSKTLFVADDEAFERFFKNNKWGVSSFEDLTEAQMKVLLRSSMLNDAMLLDMLSATSADINTEGTCMRRPVSLAVIDTVPLVTKDKMPKYNVYWDALRAAGEIADDSLRIASGQATPMMVHFLPDFLNRNAIKDSDISFFFRKSNGEYQKTYTEGEAFIFDKKVVASDVPSDGFSDDTMTITCQNGYLYRLDDVLVPPSNMAEEIRNREDLSVLSRLFDRYCLPFYEENLTKEYKELTGKDSKIYTLRYYTASGGGGLDLNYKGLNPRPESGDDVLKFDPANNQYSRSGASSASDMAAIIAPNNEAMFKYFTDGHGKTLTEMFAPDIEITDIASLNAALDCLPDKLVAPLLNNLMQETFVGTVPSRFDKIRDDAKDVIKGIDEAVQECIMANNGVIYVVDKVFGPAKYSAVTAPTLIQNNMNIVRHVVSQLGFESFLLAKEAEYSLFMPDDSAFFYYEPIDIVKYRTMNSGQLRMYELRYDMQNLKTQKLAEEKRIPYLYYNTYRYLLDEDGNYNVTTPDEYLEQTDTIPLANKKDFGANTGALAANQVVVETALSETQRLYTRMSDLIDNLIIVGNVRSGNKYYLTKGGNAVKIDMENMLIQGGLQVENGTYIAVKQAYPNQENGISFNTVPADKDAWRKKNATAVPLPATKSLFENLMAQEDFSEFMKLAAPNSFVDFEDENANFTDVKDVFKVLFGDIATINDTVKNYSIFYDDKPTSFNGVPFFKGYNYTVYAPSNEAMSEMVEKGLPTWDDIYNCAKSNDGKNLKQAVAAMKLLNNFFRYHIQDNSVFVDNNSSVATYETSYINHNGVYEILEVEQGGNELVITDVCGNTVNVIASDADSENKTWNVLCRDLVFKYSGTPNSPSPFLLVSSSASVAHRIDKALCFEGLMGYDGRVQRFAADGERVKTHYVEGKEGYIPAKDGKMHYLIASKESNYIGLDGKRAATVGYLMKPSNTVTPLSQEEYALDKNGKKVLISKEGYRVVETANGCELYTETNNAGETYLHKYDNSGESYELVLLTSSTDNK